MAAQVENVEAKLRESEEQYGKVASEKGAMEQELVAKLLALSTEMERAVLTRMEHEVRGSRARIPPRPALTLYIEQEPIIFSPESIAFADGS